MDPTQNGGRRNLTRAQLADRLNRAVEELDMITATITAMAQHMQVSPLRLQTASGELLLAPVFTAQAQALAALAQLEAAR